MDILKIKSHWDAYIYNEQETETEDVDFLRSVIGYSPKRILEVACGTGRILALLAQDGHNVTGFDCDTEMLSYIPAKVQGLNVHYYEADAVMNDWGSNHDIVIEAANLMMNIICEDDYAETQQLLLAKAAKALKPGGHLYLDFNLFMDPKCAFTCKHERVIFEGTDDWGTHGKYSILSDTYCSETQMLHSEIKTVLTLPNGITHVFSGCKQKYIPTLEQVHFWLDKAGFAIEQEYGDYHRNPISEHTCRCIIYAKKV